VSAAHRHERRVDFDRVIQWWTPPRRAVVSRTLIRVRGRKMPVTLDRLECGHEILDPGKACDNRDCSQCVPGRKIVQRPVPPDVRRRVLKMLRSRA
jgi:hypothetical protein